MGLLALLFVLWGYGAAATECDFGVSESRRLFPSECPAADVRPPEMLRELGVRSEPVHSARRFGVHFDGIRTPSEPAP